MPIDSRAKVGAAPSAGARQFTRNSAFGTLAGLLTALSSVFASVIIAHALGVAATGTVAFAMWVAMVATAIVDLGVQASLARYLPELTAARRRAGARWLANWLWRWLACSCAAAFVGFVGWAAWRWQGGAMPTAEAAMWGLVGLACALQALTGFTFGYLRGVQRFDRLALLTVVSLSCQLAGVAVGSLYFGAAGAVAGYCAGSAVPAALSLRHAGAHGLRDSVLGARVRRYALYAWAGALSSTFVWSRAELFFLQRSTGSVAAGLFTVAVTLANLASQAPILLTAGLLPYFAESFGRGAVGEMREAYATATRVLAFLVLPACFGMAALLPTALPLLYGRAFADAVPAATVLVLAAGVGATASVGATLVMAMDRSDFVFVSGLLSAVLAIAAGFTVIPVFGLIGAAWSRAVIQIAAVAMGGGFVYWRLRFPLPLFDLARLLLAAAACGVAARSCLVLTTGISSLFLAIVAGVVTYAVAVRALRALHPRDADRLRTLCGVFPVGIRAAAERVIGLLAPEQTGDAALLAATQHRSAGDAG
jgi:O-antigen/teichoic acid export membrane protein